MVEPLTTASLAAAFASKAFDELSGNLISAFIGGITDKLKLQFQTANSNFMPHLKATYDRCTKLKTILKRDEPIELIAHYVDLNFSVAGKMLRNEEAIAEIERRKKVVISGTAGTGKTVFMKYLWLSFFYNHRGRIPIFLELRRLNDLTSENVLTFIKSTLAGTHSEISDAAFNEMIRRGKFVFLFDGFDELHIEKRSRVERQILDLANDNPTSIVIVSSRPDERIPSWQAFTIFGVQPLGKQQVIDLITKINYEPTVKAKFLARIKVDLYDTHSSFLSSPLLATMMLMTFDQFLDMPRKVYLFYEQAFETLFVKHDASKEAFQRTMHTGYSMDLFKRYFSLFCLASYYDEMYDFSEQDLREYIQKGAAIENIDLDIDGFIRDLLESVCIMQRDGLRVTFSHRSFQEFFAAYSVALLPQKHAGMILNRIADRKSDNVVETLFDMDQELVESEFVVPFVKRVASSLRKYREHDDFVAQFMKFMGLRIAVGGGGSYNAPSMFFVGPGADYHRLFFLGRLYPKELRALNFHAKDYNERDEAAFRALLAAALQEGEITLEDYESGRERGLRSIIWSRDQAGDKCNLMRTVFQYEGEQVLEDESENYVPEFDIKAVPDQWVQTTGFASFFSDITTLVIKLESSVEKRRRRKSKKLEEIFGLS